MTKVYVRDGEDANRALRRFKKKVEENGVLEALRKK
jgi:ribosomal protein S21